MELCARCLGNGVVTLKNNGRVVGTSICPKCDGDCTQQQSELTTLRAEVARLERELEAAPLLQERIGELERARDKYDINIVSVQRRAEAAEAKCERVLLLKEGCWRSAGELLDGIEAALDATEGK